MEWDFARLLYLVYAGGYKYLSVSYKRVVLERKSIAKKIEQFRSYVSKIAVGICCETDIWSAPNAKLRGVLSPSSEMSAQSRTSLSRKVSLIFMRHRQFQSSSIPRTLSMGFSSTTPSGRRMINSEIRFLCDGNRRGVGEMQFLTTQWYISSSLWSPEALTGWGKVGSSAFVEANGGI